MQTELEYILNNSNKAGMIAYMKANPDSFEEAIRLSVIDKQPFSWRAAWVLFSYIDRNDIRMRPHLKEIIEVLPLRPDNQQRDLLMILQKMELDDDFAGKLLDICIEIWEKIGKQPSLRFNALKMIIKIAKSNPELKDEIKYLTEPFYLTDLSEGVKRSVQKMIKNI